MFNDYEIPALLRRNTVLVFDTETTGIIPRIRRGEPPVSLEKKPHITQISAILYDIITMTELDRFNTYVRIPESVTISEEVTNLTGVTRELCDNGMDIVDALMAFYRLYVQCNVIAAHNIEFDREMIMIELERNQDKVAPCCLFMFDQVFVKLNHIREFCTMSDKVTMNYLEKSARASQLAVSTNAHPQLLATMAGRRPPWLKLNKLHRQLFDCDDVVGLHNSMVDVLVCLRCYMKLVHDVDIGLLAIDL